MELAVAVPSLVTLGQGASGCGDEAVPDAAPAWLPGWAVVVDAGESAAPPAGTTNVGRARQRISGGRLAAQGVRVGRLQGVGHGYQQTRGLFHRSRQLRLNSQPQGLAGSEQIERQAVGLRRAEQHRVAALFVQLHFLRLRPKRATAFLQLVKREGDADYRRQLVLSAFTFFSLRSLCNLWIDRPAELDDARDRRRGGLLGVRRRRASRAALLPIGYRSAQEAEGNNPRSWTVHRIGSLRKLRWPGSADSCLSSPRGPGGKTRVTRFHVESPFCSLTVEPNLTRLSRDWRMRDETRSVKGRSRDMFVTQ